MLQNYVSTQPGQLHGDFAGGVDAVFADAVFGAWVGPSWALGSRLYAMCGVVRPSDRWGPVVVVGVDEGVDLGL